MSMSFETSIDDLGSMIQRSLQEALKDMIKRKLYETIDETLEEIAVQIADGILVRAETLRVHDSKGFGPTTRVVVQLNTLKPAVQYDSLTKTFSNAT
jgi:hypothetical protein